MEPVITNSDWQYRELKAATNSSLRQILALGTPKDTWIIGADATMTMVARPAPGHPTPLFTVTSSDGSISLVDSFTRQIMITIPQGVFSAMEAGTYYYDLLVNDAGLQIRRLAGRLVVHKGIA